MILFCLWCVRLQADFYKVGMQEGAGGETQGRVVFRTIVFWDVRLVSEEEGDIHSTVSALLCYYSSCCAFMRET